MAMLLKQGSRGPEVRDLQEALNLIACGNMIPGAQNSPLQTDGVFGPLTKARVMQFQTAAKLQSDGVVGPLTAKALVGSTLALVSGLNQA